MGSLEGCCGEVMGIQMQWKLIVSAFDQPPHYHEKVSFADLVTDTDKQVEDLVKSRILETYPDHKIIAEESTSGRSILTSDPTWIVDPIDGTSNFAQFAVVYNPICDQMFYAERGKELHSALILTDWGGDRNASNLDTKAANIRRLISEARGVRTMGSAALHMCQVAAGQGDVFFEFGIHCWDYAAASLIVTEAGGYCCNVDGGPVDLMARHCVAASSKQLAEVICQKIVPISYPRD
ncbi:unnamed protein product [Hydatigera taeniaeformis]|uniref:Inositol-1-monophosphatase n=1 Tax=Hydatigena taeniaeformis TaxID=6205 RepID=A0A0R3WHL3_HYDTA|nr:unnamed protein product [Hydatigera taeniaeformis]